MRKIRRDAQGYQVYPDGCRWVRPVGKGGKNPWEKFEPRTEDSRG